MIWATGEPSGAASLTEFDILNGMSWEADDRLKEECGVLGVLADLYGRFTTGSTQPAVAQERPIR